jgi:hypothetical protein
MRLTSAKVALVRAAVLKGTGQKWLDIGGPYGGESGDRYIGRSNETVYHGRNGAAQALSYLAGVARSRGVNLGRGDVFDIMDYLRASGRFNQAAEELGFYHGGRTPTLAPWFAMLTSHQVEEERRDKPVYRHGQVAVASWAQAQARNPQVCYQGTWHVWEVKGGGFPVPEGPAPINVTVWSADVDVFELEWSGPGIE